jgi:hypothetical protein
MSEKQTTLTRDLWHEVKCARDDAFARMAAARADYERLEDLLRRMRDAGMADDLPTAEEIAGLWSEEPANVE